MAIPFISFASSGLAPAVTATGITAGSFEDWWNWFTQTVYPGIFGADAVLDNSSQDGQFLGSICYALADCCAASRAVYNSFSPTTAQGAGLASVVKINGIQKLTSSNSTVTLTLIGQANTPITNGLATDTNGNTWALPSLVTIPSSGTIDVIATCTITGAITAAPNSITNFAPQYGWQSVTNANAAAPGAPVEDDAELRVRQSNSVSLPSQTIFEGIVAAIENVPGVTRARGIENDTDTTNGFGVPARNLDFIVEGGASSAIFAAIALKKTPGIPTWDAGGTNNNQATIVNSVGSTSVINYQTPTDATMNVAITVGPLSGWTTTTEIQIQKAVAAYMNGIPIGGDIEYFVAGALALLPNTIYNGTFRISSLTLQKNSGSIVSADIQLNYNEAAVCAPGDVVISGG